MEKEIKQAFESGLSLRGLSFFCSREEETPACWMGKQTSTFTHVLCGEESCHCLETQPDNKAVLAKSAPTAVVGEELVIPGSED